MIYITEWLDADVGLVQHTASLAEDTIIAISGTSNLVLDGVSKNLKVMSALDDAISTLKAHKEVIKNRIEGLEEVV